MRSEMKYVVFDSHKGEQIIIFPKIIQHSVMADDVKRSSFGGMRAISGGFVVNGHCVGESESLRMKSRLDVDTALIDGLLDTRDPIDDRFDFETKVIVNAPLKRNKAKRLRKQARK